MKKKHIINTQKFKSSPSDNLTNKEIQKEKKYWKDILSDSKEGDTIHIDTLDHIMDVIIEDIWSKAERFYKNNK